MELKLWARHARYEVDPKARTNLRAVLASVPSMLCTRRVWESASMWAFRAAPGSSSGKKTSRPWLLAFEPVFRIGKRQLANILLPKKKMSVKQVLLQLASS